MGGDSVSLTNCCRASAHVTEDGKRIVISTFTGFDIYALDTMQPVTSVTHSMGPKHAIPVLFIHRGYALRGGSAVGEPAIWDVTSGYKHQTFLLRGVVFLAASGDPSLM